MEALFARTVRAEARKRIFALKRQEKVSCFSCHSGSVLDGAGSRSSNHKRMCLQACGESKRSVL